MPTTMLANLVNPEVMADMLSYQLEKALKLTGFYRIDRTLTGRAGDTITVPAWKYIGMAEDVAENAQVPSRVMDVEDQKYTVKKAALEVPLTDEAVLSGYGDPVGETTKQLRMAIQEKMEEDGLTQIRGITAVSGHVYSATDPLDYDGVVDAIDLLDLEEQGTNLALLVNKTVVKNIRKDTRFADRATSGGDSVFFKGTVGSIAGCNVIISNRLEDDEAYILTPNALTIFMKRDINVETEREMSFKRTKIGSDAHYVVAIEDFDKIVKIDIA